MVSWAIGSSTQRTTPIDVVGLTSGVAAVAAGWSQTCAVTAGGGLKCWGDNAYGKLGDGTTTRRETPTDVTGLTSGVTAVAVGFLHACALTTGGGVKCWGDNRSGALGDGTLTSRLTPADVAGLTSGVVAIAAGSSHTCALTTGGAVLCWGFNYDGQLGDGTSTSRRTPTPVVGLTSGVASVEAGWSHTCAVTAGGAMKCWGWGSSGQLGDGTATQRATPTDVVGLTSGAAAADGGWYHTCAVTAAGGVKCSGSNLVGQVGDGTSTDRWTPTAVVGLATGVRAISAGSLHTCAVTTGGGVKCWGQGSYGQLGDGTKPEGQATPTDVLGLAVGVAAVAAGDSHTCALTTGGGVKCWGDNNSGQLGDPTSGPRLTPVAVLGLEGGATAPAVTAVWPVTGPLAGGTAVTITGTGFRAGAAVTFGGAAATVSPWRARRRSRR